MSSGSLYRSGVSLTHWLRALSAIAFATMIRCLGSMRTPRSRRWASALTLLRVHVVCAWVVAWIVAWACRSRYSSPPPASWVRSASWPSRSLATSSSHSASTCMRLLLCEFTSFIIWSSWISGATSPSLWYQCSRLACRDGWTAGLALRVFLHTSRSICALRFGPTSLPVCRSSSLIFSSTSLAISA